MRSVLLQERADAHGAAAARFTKSKGAYYGVHLVSIGGREQAARAFEHDLNWSCQTALSFSS